MDVSALVPIDVTCAIIENDGVVLAARRGRGMHLEGMWEFPGGKVHEGEGERDGLVREVREELGIDIEPLRRLSDSVHDYGEKVVRLIPYVCAYSGGELKPVEHSEARWFRPEELQALTWCPADMPVLEQYLGPHR